MWFAWRVWHMRITLYICLTCFKISFFYDLVVSKPLGHLSWLLADTDQWSIKKGKTDLWEDTAHFSVNVRQVQFMQRRFKILTFKYLCADPFVLKGFLECPVLASHSPLIQPLAYWSTQKGNEWGWEVLWHSCVFWDHHVSLRNTCLVLLSRRKYKAETNHAHLGNNSHKISCFALCLEVRINV